MTLLDTCGPTQTPGRHRHRRAAGEVPARARQAAAPRRLDAVPGARGRLRRLLRDRSVHAGDARATRSSRTSRSPSSAAASPACWPARISRRPVSRTSGSSRWPATSAASGTGTASRASSATTMPTATSRCSKSSTSSRRRSSPTAPRSSSTASDRQAFRPLRRRDLLHPGARRCAGTSRLKRWRISTNRGDDIRARFVVMAPGLLQPAEAARHPRHQGLQGAHLPLGALGLRLHRRRRQRRTAQARRQARRARRHRRHRRPAGSAPGPRCQAALRVPAHAVLGGRARQTRRPTRSGRSRCSRAGRRSASATSTAGHRSTVWSSAQPDLVCDFWTELGRNMTARIARQRGPGIAGRRADHGDPGRRRLQGHGAAAAPRREPRRRPADRRGAQAVLPVHVQAAVHAATSTYRPSTGPTSRWSTSRSPRAWSG